ncbi:MAG TPA: ABC transporter permease [Rhizomicrobium sp.]|nr:ABC transporter permease [Rhizomicrobium sp.]
MSMLRQIAIVSLLNFRNLRQRRWQSLVVVAGMACVIGVLLSMLSMAEGVHQANLNNGDPRNAIVVSRGTVFEGNSSIPRDKAHIVMAAPGIAKAADGSPIADPILSVGVPARLQKNGGRTWIALRSFGKNGALLHPTFHMVAGRMFRPGARELIVGDLARFQVAEMRVGDKVSMPDGEWPIVGAFATGDMMDGRLVGDTETLMASLRRKAYTTIQARMASPAVFVIFRGALTSNPALAVDVMRLPEWNAKSSADFIKFMHVIIYGVGVILAIGALFACFNTMYAAVESRGREIATLRALGYGGFAVAASVVLEAAALSVAGALIGASAAWSLYDGVLSGLGSEVFTLTVSPPMIGTALLWAVAVALLGGILPSIQAARWTVSDALRAR